MTASDTLRESRQLSWAERDGMRVEPLRLDAVLRECLSAEGGFLPECVPLAELPAPFDRYVATLMALPDHYHGIDCAVRGWLDELFGVWHERLSAQVEALNTVESEKLMTVLSVLCHAYRWNRMPAAPESYHSSQFTLPRGLAQPWQQLAQRLEQPRVGNVYNMVLCNFSLSGHTPGTRYLNHDLTNDRIDVAHSWLRAPDRAGLAAFVRSAVLTEARGATAIKTGVQLLNAAGRKDASEVSVLLERFAQQVTAMGAGFKVNIRDSQMRRGAFLTLIQPTTLWGISEGQEILEGASGPQIGSIQAVDAILGIRHETNMGRAILHSRRYMPARHRYFLDLLDARGAALRDFVSEAGEAGLSSRFNACVEIMLAWRRMHVTRAAYYLKGDGVVDIPNYTSTGNVVSLDDQRVARFEGAMAERIAETTRAQVDGGAQNTESRAVLTESVTVLDQSATSMEER